MSDIPALLPVKGTCFGFEVRSELAFQFLRHGEGEPIEITTHTEEGPVVGERLVVEWKQRPSRPFYGRVYQNDQGRYRLWASDAGWFLVDPKEGTIAVPESGDPLRREVRLWITPMLLLMVSRGDLLLHASAVEIDGGAVVFGGPSHFGKTTLAAAFHAAGFRVLAEDVTCVRTAGEPRVIPGPAMLRVRHDVVDHFPARGVIEIGADHDRKFLALSERLRGTCDPLPLKGIMTLKESPSGIRLQRRTSTEVLSDLWILAFRFPGTGEFRRAFSGIADVADRVPVWDLLRPMEVESLELTVERVVAEVTGREA